MVKLAFVHLPSGRSRFSTMYPVILLPPSNAGFCQERVIEVLEISEARTFLGGSAEGNIRILPIINSYFEYWLTVQNRLSQGKQNCWASLFSREYIPQASIARTGSEGRLGFPMPAAFSA